MKYVRAQALPEKYEDGTQKSDNIQCQILHNSVGRESLIALYHTDGTPINTVIPLISVVRKALEDIFKRSLSNTIINIAIYRMPAEAYLNGMPGLLNLSSDYGHAQVTLKENDIIIYQHSYTVEELIGKPLQILLQNSLPDIKKLGYYLSIRGMPKPPPKVQPF